MKILQIRTMLQSQGFMAVPRSPLECWEKREGKLHFRANIGVVGLGKEGLSINASYWDGDTMYDSDGMISRSVFSILMHPEGFLGPDPTLNDILERMEDIREEVGRGDPKLKAFQRAILYSDVATVKKLLEDNPLFFIPRRRGLGRGTFLHDVRGRQVALALIFDGFDINATDISGCTPLHSARTPGVVSALLQYDADVNSKNLDGNTPLHEMINHGRSLEASLLLHSGADPNLQNNTGLACLHVATSSDAVRLLMEYDADPNMTDALGRTPLHYARDSEIANALMHGGANITADSKGALPIHTACTEDVAEYFVHHGMDAFAVDASGQTPLHYAVRSNRHCIIKYLLFEASKLLHRAHLNTRDVNGLTALHLASDTAIARLLIQAGADVMARDVNRKTPLHHCSFTPVMKVLVAAGADVNAADVRGKTALHDCYGNRIARALINLGADVSATDDAGKTPLDYPKSNRARAMLRREMKRKQNK